MRRGGRERGGNTPDPDLRREAAGEEGADPRVERIEKCACVKAGLNANKYLVRLWPWPSLSFSVCGRSQGVGVRGKTM